MPRRVQRINYDKLWNSWIDAMTTSMIRWQRKPLNVCVLVHFFFTVAHFHLALVASSISHFVTAATKFSCCSSNKKMSPLFFISRSKSLSPFFSLSFAGLPPTFSFSLSFSCSIFQICGHDNLSKLNTLDNTDTETISAFRFRLYWLFYCLCFTRRRWLCDFPPK